MWEVGEVYRKYDKPLNRDVAYKVMLDKMVADDERVLQFIEEADNGRLEHPNIVPVHNHLLMNLQSIFYYEVRSGDSLSDVIKVLSSGESRSFWASTVNSLC